VDEVTQTRLSRALGIASGAAGLLAGALAIYAGVLGWAYYSTSPGAVRRHHLESIWFVIAALGLLRMVPRVGRLEMSPQPGVAARELAGTFVGAACVTLALYWSAIGIGFLSDDFVLLAHAAARQWIGASASPFIRPVPLMVWAAMIGLFETTPAWFHLLTLVLHAANGALVYGLARRSSLPASASVVAAALFLVNPTSVEAVAWASGIQDLLMTTLCLVFVLMTLSVRSPLTTTIAALSLVLGLLSKETAVVAPALSVVALAASGRGRERNAVAVGLGVAICFGYGAWRLVHGVPASYASPASGYLLKELVSRPFASLAVPWTRDLLARYPDLGRASVAFFALLIVLTMGRWRTPSQRTRAAGLWAAWVVISILPLFSYFYVSPDLQGSRYLYLGSVGWGISVAILVAAIVERPGRAWKAVAAVMAAGLLVGGLTGSRVALGPWSEAARLRQQVVDAAARVVPAPACGSYAFDALPDAVEGAYVFRNGFTEALAMRGGATPGVAAGDARPQCRFRWDGRGFVRAASAVN
jgi:hypothetical protein